MITLQHELGNLWLKLKLFFTLGKTGSQAVGMKPIMPKPKRRSHRTTAFFEMP